jgi:hypothetical protein
MVSVESFRQYQQFPLVSSIPNSAKEDFAQDTWCLVWDSKWILPEYNAKASDNHAFVTDILDIAHRYSFSNYTASETDFLSFTCVFPITLVPLDRANESQNFKPKDTRCVYIAL